MNLFNKIIAVTAILSVINLNVFAEETTFRETADEKNISVTEITSNTDNSNLIVKVIKVAGGVETVLYEGLLENYENGLWSFIDFSEIDFSVIFEWGLTKNETIYIIPQRTIADETNSNSDSDVHLSDNADQHTTETNKSLAMSLRSTELIEYDITYSFNLEDALNIDINYNVYNGNSENKNVSLIAALYNNGRLCDLKTQALTVTAQTNEIDNIVLQIPENNDNCYVRLMVWDGLGTIKPIGNAKCVADLDNYIREKYLYITSNADVECNIFMNATTVKGANSDMIHTLQYDPLKITPIDLCGFTYEKELNAGTTGNSDVIIQDVDLNAGKIQYRFNLSEGRNTGVTNVVKFKTLSQVENEQIIYTIQ